MILLIVSKCGHHCLLADNHESDETIDGESVCCRCLGVFKEDWCRLCRIQERMLGDSTDKERMWKIDEVPERLATPYHENMFEALDWARAQIEKYRKQ